MLLSISTRNLFLISIIFFNNLLNISINNKIYNSPEKMEERISMSFHKLAILQKARIQY